MKKTSSEKKMNLSDIVTVAVFTLILFGFLISNIARTPQSVSKSERRNLAQLPEITLSTIADASFMDKFEDFALDQFALRDRLRTVKSLSLFNVFLQTDNNDIYVAGEHVSKFETLRIDPFGKGIDKIQRLQEEYLSDMKVFIALVPDKNYYLAPSGGYPRFDYDYIREATSVIDAKHIDLYESINSDDYYRTDIHWNQPHLQGILDTLGSAMGFAVNLDEFTPHTLSPFYGGYYGHSALPLKPDTLTYLTNAATESAEVMMLDDKTHEFKLVPMYDETKFTGIDPYDLFLQGATPVITISNANAASERELIIFRDSYTSSLAPLLSGVYSKITLVDLRYIASPLLGDYVDFNANVDALFLLSPSIINNSEVLMVR